MKRNKIKVLEEKIKELEKKRESQEKANIQVSSILSNFGEDYSQRAEKHREVLLDINNSLINLCELLGSKWDNPIDAIPQLLEWAHSEKKFLQTNNKKLNKGYERPSCLICRKTFQDYYCPDCHDNTFHKAHITLLQGYMKHDDPIKEIKRILYGETQTNICQFCGRELILYKDKWICGHGCLKPALKGKESTEKTKTTIEFIQDSIINDFNKNNDTDYMLIKKVILKRIFEIIDILDNEGSDGVSGKEIHELKEVIKNG